MAVDSVIKKVKDKDDDKVTPIKNIRESKSTHKDEVKKKKKKKKKRT